MKSRLGQNGVTRLTGIAHFTLLALVALAMACAESTGVAGSVRIQPATPTVALQTTPLGLGLQTSVTLTNTSSTSIRWARCGMALQKRDAVVAVESGDGAWVSVWTEVCAYAVDDASTALTSSSLLYPGEAVLQPGSSVVIPITAPVGPTPYSFFRGDPGTYRVRLYLSTDFLGRNYPLPPERSVSDSFTVTEN
jgi:hypothetical protein